MLKINIKCSKVILNLEISCFKILNKSHMQKFDIWTLKQPCDFTTIPVQYSCSLDFKLVILNYPCLVQLLLRIQTSVVFEMNDSMVLAFVFFFMLCLLYFIEQIHQLRLETRQPRRIVRAFWLKWTIFQVNINSEQLKWLSNSELLKWFSNLNSEFTRFTSQMFPD